MKQPIELLRELVRLYDAGIRPQVLRGMQREEDEFYDLIRDAQECIAVREPVVETPLGEALDGHGDEVES